VSADSRDRFSPIGSTHLLGVAAGRKNIAAKFDVNVRTGVRQLEAEGPVTSVRRRGTVVRAVPPLKRLDMERYAMPLARPLSEGNTIAAAPRQCPGPMVPMDRHG
jgi:hypothetical protein